MVQHAPTLSLPAAVLVACLICDDCIGKDAPAASVVVRISGQSVCDQLARPVDKLEPVDTVILGTRAVGTAHTIGEITTRVVPNDEHAQIRLEFEGQTTTRTHGRKGPAIVKTIGQTDLVASMDIFVASDGRVQIDPVQIDGKTRSRTAGIESSRTLLRPIVRKLARARVDRLRPQTEAIGKQRTLARVSTVLESEVRREMESVAAAFAVQQWLPAPLASYIDGPARITSTDREIRVAFYSDELDPVEAPVTELEGAGSISVRRSLIEDVKRRTASTLNYFGQSVSIFKPTAVHASSGIFSYFKNSSRRSVADTPRDPWITINLDESIVAVLSDG